MVTECADTKVIAAFVGKLPAQNHLADLSRRAGDQQICRGGHPRES